MNNRSTLYTLLLALGLAVSSSLSAQPSGAPQFDPYLPGELNERALYALKSDDTSTALILLERAYRLNPNSPDIKANLEIVRNINRQKLPIQVSGEVIYLDVSGNPIAPESFVEVPALWPAPKP
jgi:hypothetical protein